MTAHPTFPDARPSERESQLMRGLSEALAHQRLHLVYQPELDLLTGEVFALEALCRWNDPVLGVVSPLEFIRVAEDHRMIAEVGRYVLQRVLQDLPTLLQRWPNVRVAINASGLELDLPDFATGVLTTIDAADPALARHLEFEVTESLFHHDVNIVRQQLQALRDHGIRIAIDDFGTGQSSLARLHTLPFDKVKLDQAFAHELHNPMVQAIVRAMATLAAQFERELVVEGVETAEQMRLLIELGCRRAQGYLFCRPCTLEALPEHIALPA